MSINQKMNALGDIGAKGYDPSSEVLTHLVSRTRRQRMMRQGTTALAGSVGAVALALVTVQVVAAVEQGPTSPGGTSLDNVSTVQKYFTKPADELPIDFDLLLAKIQAEAEAEKAAEEEAAAKAAAKAAEEEAAAKAAEEEAAKKAAEKETSKPKATTEPKECDPAAKPYDTYDDHYEKCHEGTIYKKAKPGYIDLDKKFYKIIQWTDFATGNKYWGAYEPTWKKLVITPNEKDGWWAGHYYPETWSSNTCYGKTKFVAAEGDNPSYTKMESCYDLTWHVVSSS